MARVVMASSLAARPLVTVPLVTAAAAMPTASDLARLFFFLTPTMSKRAFSTPTAAAVLQNGRWSAAEVATLLDVPVTLVERWAPSRPR